MPNDETRKSKGFTIIEVLIVLAIAGLILLIVFLAVPALNRNSRNTQRRTDVSKFLGGVQEVANNTNGDLPTTAAAVTDLVDEGFYKAAGTVTLATCTVGGCTAYTPTVDNVQLNMNASCPASVTATGAITTTYKNRSYVALYAVESSSGALINQCTQS